MSGRPRGLAFVCIAYVGIGACSAGDVAEPSLPEPGSSTGSTTTEATSTEGTTPGTSSASSDGGDGTDAVFVDRSDFAGPDLECDLFVGDCPRGEKCAPVGLEGARDWNATRCVPIARDPAAPGEPCTVEGDPLSGLDDCEAHALCWDVDPVTLEGWCVAMCIGDQANPTCADPNATCEITNNGASLFCYADCNPLLHDCGAGRGCYPIDDELRCAPDASGDTTVGAPCRFINDCPDGTACVDATLVPDCATSSCCSAFCALDDPACLAGQQCLPWHEADSAPRGQEQLGLCGVSR